MFHRIKEVKPMNNLHLLATFYDDAKKIYDVNQVLHLWQMSDLKNIPFLFEQVKVDKGGYGVVWNDYLDLSSEEIWSNGTLVEEEIISLDKAKKEMKQGEFMTHTQLLKELGK